MPRNLTGGNKAKSGKNENTKAEFHEIDESQGQMVGRIVKGLGDRNMLIYCNDGKERIAHIRGGLRKKVARLETGDIVLISLRGEAMGATQGRILDKGDILAKYEREVYGQLKKVDGINPRIFNQLEIMDVKQRASGITAPDDCGFDMDGGEEEDEDDAIVETNEERDVRKLKEETKRSLLRNVKESVRNGKEDDIDIDAI